MTTYSGACNPTVVLGTYYSWTLTDTREATVNLIKTLNGAALTLADGRRRCAIGGREM